MAEKSYRDAIRDAMMEEMDRDANVLIMGEDILSVDFLRRDVVRAHAGRKISERGMAID